MPESKSDGSRGSANSKHSDKSGELDTNLATTNGKYGSSVKEQEAIRGLAKLCSKLYEDERNEQQMAKENKRKTKESLKRTKVIPTDNNSKPSQVEIQEPPAKVCLEEIPFIEPQQKAEFVEQKPQPTLLIPPVPSFTGYNPGLFYSGLFFGANNPLTNYMMLQKKSTEAEKTCERPKEEKKAVPFKRQTMHIGAAHYIERAKKTETKELLAREQLYNASLIESRGLQQNWKERPEFPYGLGFSVYDMINAQRMMRPIQEISGKEMYDKSFH